MSNFFLFPQCFLLNQKLVSLFVNIYDIISLFAAELEEPKIGISGKGLTFYVQQNFSIAKIQSSCRLQFSMMLKLFPNGQFFW